MPDAPMEKILIIRMLGLGDVTCIGIPAIRHIRKRHPEAEITVLTFSAGKEIISLAEPSINIIGLDKGQWPDDIIPAMEVFLGLANTIIGQAYTQVINLDTWFMPCFLARFLKDTGSNVTGNWMSISAADLISQFEKQTLTGEYVNNPANYMQSSFVSMNKWHTPWWLSASPSLGYPEYYLRQCCGYTDIDMDMSIAVPDFGRYEKLKQRRPIVALATEARTSERRYPYGDKLATLLTQSGVEVWTGFDGSEPMKKTLSKLRSSDLLVSVPSAPQWLATAVGCPVLIISGQVDPRTLMPQYNTEQSKEAVAPHQLADQITSILKMRRTDR